MGFQSGWKRCGKCKSLFYATSNLPGTCPRDNGPHEADDSGQYALFMPAPGRLVRAATGPFDGQAGWKWCWTCQCLYFSGAPSRCSTGQPHLGMLSADYAVDFRQRPGYLAAGEPPRTPWRWCSKCGQMVLPATVDPGPCAGGGSHDTPRSYDYAIDRASALHGPHKALLLVIAPAQFLPTLEPLIAHKNQTLMETFVAPRENLTEFFSGSDDPEKIKRAIAFAYEYLETRYVMLVGDASLIPVRYRRTTIHPDDRNWRDGWFAPSDLYYANLYRDHSDYLHAPVGDELWGRNSAAVSGFSDWDGRRDGLYNEHHWRDDTHSFNPDGVDGFPDLAVGRLPAHRAEEVSAYVDRVIRYERGDARPRLREMTIVADADPNVDPPGLARWFLEGLDGWAVDLVACDYPQSEPLPLGFRRTLGTWPSVERAAEVSTWITYIGHGYPEGWEIAESGRLFDTGQVIGFNNATNLPIVYAAACATGHFINPPPEGRYRDIDGQTHWYGVEAGVGGSLERPNRVFDLGDRPPGSQPVREWHARDGITPMITPELPHPYDFPDRRSQTFARGWLFGEPSWALRGGAIAYFGQTTVSPADYAVELGNLMLRSYTATGQILGDIWIQGQRGYWRRHLHDENCISAARLYLTYMTFFGDPSLRLP